MDSYLRTCDEKNIIQLKKDKMARTEHACLHIMQFLHMHCNKCLTTIQEVNSRKRYSFFPFQGISCLKTDLWFLCWLLKAIHVYSQIFFTLQNKWCLVLMTIKRMMLMSPKKQRQLSNIKRYEELLSHAFGTRCYLSLQHCHHNDCVPQS